MPTLRKYSSRSQQTTLTSAVTAGASTIVVGSGASLLGGATVTSPEVFTVVINPDTALEEIVDVTAVSTNTLTIVRGRDGSSGQNHSAGAVVRHMAIGRDYREANEHANDTTTAHGVTGAVVGTTNTQTLTNKTLTNPTVTTGSFSTPTIAGATISGAFTSTATITGGTISGAVVTGLTSSALADTQATPKNYVDAFFGPLTSALTSSTSAATSATSAATSATSAASSASAAATSASSALTSQTAAATSATSAAASATAAATSATSAAASATAAATSATSAAASATTAAASVATIAGYSANADAQATAAATSATSAAASATAAATSATSAAASATTASNSAATATTQAGNASASATAAATSATSAAASATAAATSATSAATSASSALTSETAAATSAASAATSASSAATTYDNFDDRYLGSKASAPTVDNDGNTLLVGAIYWNANLNNMYVWSGTMWVQIATTSVYTAPTLGSDTIASGTTYTNINGLTINSTTIPSSKTLVDTNSGQSLTNKTLDGAVAAADPSVALGLATKQYVDNIVTGLNFHAPVVAATTTEITGTYSNGSSGVGATFTVTATGEHVIDGVTPVLNNRVLIKDQTTQTQNGVYTLTTAGTTGVSAVYTRATDQDNSVAGEMANGDDFNVQGGTVNSGKSFVNSTVGTITIGTTNITYSAYYAGLPDQSTNAGKYLTTDGTTPSWGDVQGGAQVYDTLMLMGA